MAGFNAKYAVETLQNTQNTELNDLRIIICLGKSEVIVVERVPGCNFSEKLMQINTSVQLNYP